MKQFLKTSILIVVLNFLTHCNNINTCNDALIKAADQKYYNRMYHSAFDDYIEIYNLCKCDYALLMSIKLAYILGMENKIELFGNKISSNSKYFCETKYIEAKYFFESGNTERAKEILTLIDERENKSIFYLYLSAKIYESENEIIDAALMYAELMSLYPYMAEAHDFFANYYRLRNDVVNRNLHLEALEMIGKL